MKSILALVLLPALGVAADACAGTEQRLQEVENNLTAGKLTNTEPILEALQRTHPQCPRVWVALGRFQLAKSDYQRASAFSEVALLNGPDDAEALLFRGEMLVMQGQMDQAEELLDKACKLAPNSAEAHFQLGRTFDARKRNSEAAAEFAKTIALRPEDPRGYDYLALNLEPLGEVTRAEAAYKQGLAVNTGPQFDSFLDYNYGRLLMKLNRLAESKVHLDKAMELTPRVRAVSYERAKLNLRMGQLEAARSDGERALNLPDQSGVILDVQIYSLLATVCTRLDRKAEAQKYIHLAENASVPVRARERK